MNYFNFTKLTPWIRLVFEKFRSLVVKTFCAIPVSCRNITVFVTDRYHVSVAYPGILFGEGDEPPPKPPSRYATVVYNVP